MNLKTLLRSIFRGNRVGTITRNDSRFRPWLEVLEDRLAPANFTVLHNADAGIGSLRQAILDANLTAAADTITFSAALNNQTILLGGTEMLITKPLTINGPGAALLKIDANNASRIFNVDDFSGTSIAVAISGLTLTKGNSGNSGGGAIRNVETLTVTNSTLSGNSASFGGGGGIFNSGTVTVTNSTFTGNSTTGGGANGVGGGILSSSGSLTLANSTFSANTAFADGGALFLNNGTSTIASTTFVANSALNGGGLRVNSATVNVTNSTFAGNSASNAGGAIASVGTVTVTNSTLSGNSSPNGGGMNNSGNLTLTNSTLSTNSGTAVVNFGTLRLMNSTVSGNDGGGMSNAIGTLTITNSTVVGNRKASGAGAGIANSDAATLFNTIVAGNLTGAGAGTASELGGTSLNAASRNNLIGDPATAGGLTHGNFGNILGKDNGAGGRMLLPLAELLDPILRNNGGATQTHALIPGSAAIDGAFDNLAHFGTAVQSSTLGGFPAGNAIDANFGTFSHTDTTDTTASWTLTLPGTIPIGTITLFNRAGLEYRLRDITIQILDAANNVLLTSPLLNPENVLNGPGSLRFNAGGILGAKIKVLRTADPDSSGSPTHTTLDDRNTLTLVEVDVRAAFDQRGAGFPRMVGTQTDIGAYEMPRALFSDTFDRDDSPSLGAPWINQAGGVQINGTVARGTTAGVNVATLANFSAADVDLHVLANLLGGTQAGLLARFVDVNNYYGATLTKEPTGLITARLVKFVNGVYTELAVFENTAASGKLRLRVVGNTLQMYLDGTLLATAIDFSLSSGSVGVRTLGIPPRLINFLAFPIATGIDRFDPFTLPDNSTLSDPWVQPEGYFRTTGNRVQGAVGLNRAVLQGALAGDVDIRAKLAITGVGHFTSILARYNGAADSWYQALLIRNSTSFDAYIFRRLNGVFAQIGNMVVVPSVSGVANVRFVVAGSSLKFYVNDTLTVEGMDSALTTGTVGFRSDNYGFIDDFSVRTVKAELPFSDNFSGLALDLPWISQVTPFTLTGGSAVPATNAISLATLAGVNAHSAEVQADITITNTGGVGSLVLGYNGPGNSNYYTALAYRQPGNAPATPFSLYLFRRDASTYVQLGPEVQVAALGTLKFRMLGNQLTLLLNNVVQITATDNTFTGGSVGIRGFVDSANAGTVAIDNFTATNLNFVPFTDSFTAATLDPNWMARAGGYTTTAVAGKAKGTTAGNHMTLGRFDLADVNVQATINVANVNGNFAALTARVSTAADPDFYQAVVYWTGTQFNADIFKKVGAVFTQLGTFNLGSGAGAGSGVLRFSAVGGQLKLSFAGVEKLSVFDFSLRSGSVGVRSSLDPTFDNFSVASIS